MASIEELAEIACELEHELWLAQGELVTARIEAASFKVGEIVEARVPKSKEWKRAIVRRVEPTSWGWGDDKEVLAYLVSFARKDGKRWSSAERRIFDGGIRLVSAGLPAPDEVPL